jgi:hypothetical protein
MDDLDNLDCKIYVEAEQTLDDSAALLRTWLAEATVNGPVMRTIPTRYGEIEVRKNKEADKLRAAEFPDGFVFFRYVLEFYPFPATRHEDRVALVTKLVNRLWSRGLPAVAACDYENELPCGGGYNSRSVPWPSREVSLLKDRWQELVRRVRPKEPWQSPWINTTFANGEPFRDGNRVFSAVCPTLRRGICVIQLEPSGNGKELYFWTDTFAKGDPEEISKLVISCTLTDETLLETLDLIHQWVTKGEVRLSREGYYPTFPQDPQPSRGRRREMALVA